MKSCSICQEYLSLDNFDKQSTGKLGCRADCKQCRKRFYHSPEGLAKQIFSNQKAKSKKRGHVDPSYTEKELYDWLIIQSNFKSLYDYWVVTNYNTDDKPSVDRKDDYLPYTLNNIQLTTVLKNCQRYYNDAKIGINTKSAVAVDQYTKEGLFVASHHSYRAAARAVGYEGIGNIRNVAEGLGKSAYGFLWRKP